MAEDRRPPKCECQPDTWQLSRPIPPVCASYAAPHKKSGRSHCTDCGHDPECHGLVRSPARRASHRMAIEILRTS